MIVKDMLSSSIRWAAVIHGVQEVILAGVADLTYWRKGLASEGLFPFNAAGYAEILISAPRLAWMGLHFRELSIGIAVAKREDATAPEGTFLIHAFNSSPLLAWSERTFFGTPYFPADIEVNTDVPVGCAVTQGNQRLLNARMAASPALLRSGEERWEGPVYLPRARAEAKRRYFIAHLSGETHTYRFAAGSDVFELTPLASDDAIAHLRDSGFAPREWRVRQDALHAKSRTMSE
jgi:hypothetical protein